MKKLKLNNPSTKQIKNNPLISQGASKRKGGDLAFSLTNTKSTNLKKSGTLIPYRCEPIFPTYCPRQGLGFSRGWGNDHFLEFAPNVKQLIEDDNRKENRPRTKEQFIEDFLNEVGIDPQTLQENEKKSFKTKKDVAPMPWEVKEKLREMINEHEDTIEKEKIFKLKQKILFAGEIDPTLSSKKTRVNKERERQSKKEKELLKEASQSRREAPAHQSQKEDKETRKKLIGEYQLTRKSYQRGTKL
jgi:hypothetical protein